MARPGAPAAGASAISVFRCFNSFALVFSWSSSSRAELGVSLRGSDDDSGRDSAFFARDWREGVGASLADTASFFAITDRSPSEVFAALAVASVATVFDAI
jgi:hypothetical protein